MITISKHADVKHLLIALMLSLALVACKKPTQTLETVESSAQATVSENVAADSSNAELEQAFATKKSNVHVSGKGVVVKLLPDDTHGAQHQKFLVKINSHQTLLFAHNIDLAGRVPLQVDDEITFSGEYVYNPKGGIMHWTHLDPHGHHAAGWLMVHGNKYQ